MDTGSRLCKSANEDIIQIMASCPMSVCYYQPLRDDVIAKIVYNALIHNKNTSYRKKVLNMSIRKAIWNTGGTLV